MARERCALAVKLRLLLLSRLGTQERLLSSHVYSPAAAFRFRALVVGFSISRTSSSELDDDSVSDERSGRGGEESKTVLSGIGFIADHPSLGPSDAVLARALPCKALDGVALLRGAVPRVLRGVWTGSLALRIALPLVALGAMNMSS